MQRSVERSRPGHVRAAMGRAPGMGLLMAWLRRSMPVAMALLLATGARAGIQLTSLPDQLSQSRQCGAATSVGTQALFAGGCETLSGVDIYDAATNAWSTASLSQGRFQMAATTVGTKALFGGGATDLMLRTPSDRVDIYEGGAWSTASLSLARGNLAATSVSGQALFAGGDDRGYPSSRVDIYDSSSNSWSTASLSEARTGLAATSVGSQALFAGGSDNSNVVDIYEGGAWSTGTLSEGRCWLAAATAGGVALFGGGVDVMAGLYSAAVDIYDPATGTWTTASLSQARGQLAATGVGDFAFFGGGVLSGPSSKVVDIYHVPSDTWYTAELSRARCNLMATTVGNQAIFAGGGTWGKTVDIFEVTDTSAWTRPAASGPGDWADDANWDSVIVPLTTDHLSIANGGSAQLGGCAQAASVTVGEGAGGTLDLLPGSSLSVPTIHVGSLGTLNVSQDWTYDGMLTISGGDVTLGANKLFLDAGGALEIAGSTLSADHLVVGDTGSASATQSGGTTTIGGGLQVGVQATGDGTYELSGDVTVQLDVGGNAVMGVSGTGRFIQTGGVHHVGDELRIAMNAGARGTYELGGGDLSVTGFGVFGWNGEGTFKQSGGTHTAGRRLYLGYRASGVGGYELGGTSVLSATAGEQIGYEGTGTFTQTGGTHQVTGNLVLGYASGGNGTYTMEDGTLDVVGTLRVGRDGTGRLELSGGDVTASELSIGAQGTVAFSGDALSVGSVTNQGTLNWSGGTLNVTGAGGLALGAGEPLGSALTLDGFQALNVTNQMTVPLGSTLTVGPGAGFSAGSMNSAGTALVLTGTVDFGGGLTNTGSAVFMGTTVAGPVYTPTGSTVTILDTVTFNDLVSGGGSFWGPGTAVFNAGHEPGDSPGLVTFEGCVAYGPMAHLVMEIDGPTAGDDYDVIGVGGSLALGGTLDVVVDSGYRPGHGTAFQITTFASRGGTTFDTHKGLDLGDRLALVPTYGETDLVLTAVQGGPGEWAVDADGDASVPANWSAGLPNGVADVATFGPVITAAREVAVDVPTVLGEIVLASAQAYVLAGPNPLTFDTDTGVAAITVTNMAATHTIGADVILADALVIDVGELGTLIFEGLLDNGAGLALTKTGDGCLTVDGPQTHGADALLEVLAGTVEMNTPAGTPGAADLSISVFGDAVLEFGANQYLDTLSIWDDGLVRFTGARVVVVRHLVLEGVDLGEATLTPEPATLTLLALGGLLLRRRRRK